MRRLAIISALLVIAAGCAASGGKVAELPREPPLSEKQIAERQALFSASGVMRPTAAERFDVAVVGGACAPKPLSRKGITACVNNRPCNGFGLRTAEGAIVCACYQVRDGCPAGNSCDTGTRECRPSGGEKYPNR
jgi:hypothetical protein